MSPIATTGVWNIESVVEPVVEAEGRASRPPTTVSEAFQKCVALHSNKRAITTKVDGEWKSYTWAQYYQNCVIFARSLIAIGLKPFESVNVLGFNSPEWFFANNGTILAGGVIAGIYTTNGSESCQYISEHSKAVVVVVEGMAQLKKYLPIVDNLPHLKGLVVYNGEIDKDITCKIPIYSFKDFLKLGKSVDQQVVEERIQAQKPGNCCTLIYTSGTTGPPKAVMISHDNLTWISYCVVETFHITAVERSVSFLPLSHVAAQVLDIHLPMVIGNETFFADANALKGSLVDTLKEIRPTFFFGVPRVWEKIMEQMQLIGSKTTGIKRTLATWAKHSGAKKTAYSQYGSSTKKSLSYPLANALVLKKIKAALGLDECKYFFTGAAPIAKECLGFFGNLDIPIFELFGQSECTGPHTLNSTNKWKIGSTGPPIVGTHTRIDPQSGEIQYKGRHIFMGYLNMPDKTSETIKNGWLHSGDVGKLDEDGFLYITGRIKELIITAGGENVPPVLIEDQLKNELSALSNIMVIGDRRKYLTFLYTYRTEMDSNGVPTNKLDRLALNVAKVINSTATTVEEAMTCDKFDAYIQKGIKNANAKATSRAQFVQKCKCVKRDFSIAGGELTPTLKLKRDVVVKMYTDEIESMYA